MTPDPDTEFFEALRPRLYGIAYRMLGVVPDAEDAVRQAFLRWRQAADAPRSAVPTVLGPGQTLRDLL